jgi:uncharacterized membrane protein
MHKGRLEAFSDGVLAIIITIMVLELRAPSGSTLADIAPLIPVFLSYALSFVYVGIYWNNHHHMFQASGQVNGAVMWANLHLLFWLSLTPFATGWVGEHHSQPLPVALYGFVLMMSGLAYALLARRLIRLHGEQSTLARALGRDLKGKGSIAAYAAAIGLAWVSPAAALTIYVLVALVWLVPDRRIERSLSRA